MFAFKVDRKIYLTNEIISWLVGILLILLLYFGFKLFSLLTHENLMILAVSAFVLKFGDTLTQYHVTEIQIDRIRNQLIFKLNSPFSGEKAKTYELAKVSWEIHENSGPKRFLYSPILLKVIVAPKGTFRITSRYGFSAESLISIANTLELDRSRITV